MLDRVEVIYENGVLRPLQPLPLAEHEHVLVSVARTIDEDWLDQPFMNACAVEGEASVTLDEVRRAMSKIHGSMDEAIDADRGDL